MKHGPGVPSSRPGYPNNLGLIIFSDSPEYVVLGEYTYIITVHVDDELTRTMNDPAQYWKLEGTENATFMDWVLEFRVNRFAEGIIKTKRIVDGYTAYSLEYHYKSSLGETENEERMVISTAFEANGVIFVFDLDAREQEAGELKSQHMHILETFQIDE